MFYHETRTIRLEGAEILDPTNSNPAGRKYIDLGKFGQRTCSKSFSSLRRASALS